MEKIKYKEKKNYLLKLNRFYKEVTKKEGQIEVELKKLNNKENGDK